jgi:hypothetical protein
MHAKFRLLDADDGRWLWVTKDDQEAEIPQQATSVAMVVRRITEVMNTLEANIFPDQYYT